MSNPVVVDLSHHNPTPNWPQLKAGGTIGVIHKATEGSSYKDPTLFDRAKAAMAADLKWSTYHFLRPGDMDAQMAFYLKTVNPVQGERVCLDHEDSGVSLDDLIEAVRFLQQDPRDLQVCVYSGHVIKEQLGNNHSDVLATTSLWIAQYTTASAPSWPTGTWPAWSLWQFTDKASYQGISAKCDGNYWNGSTDALLAWFGPAGAQPAPPVESKPEIRFTVETTGSLRVLVNGEVVIDT